MHACRRKVSLTIAARTLATAAPPPPRASPDQIFLTGRKASKVGSSIASEDDWLAAVQAAEKATDRENDEGISGPGDASLFAVNRVGQIPLPASLTRPVSSVLGEAHGPHIRSTALRFYESLNLEKPSKIPMPLSKDFTSIEADAYLAGLMPQLYASVHIVLLELRKRLGRDWQPNSVLDCGVGPGTAALAFNEVFFETNPHPLTQRPLTTIIEPNYELRRRTETIWKDYSRRPEPESAEMPDRSSTEDPPKYQIFPKMGATGQKYDLILAPHYLSDFHGRPSDRDYLSRDLWSRLNTGGVLLILERGNPLGFEKVAHARQLLLSKKVNPPGPSSSLAGHVIAPCPGDGQCPLYAHGHQPARRQWCHFSQRLQRPDYLQLTRHSKFNVEDVNYSYVLLRKGMARPSSASDELKSEAMEDSETDSEQQPWKGGIVSASYRWSRIILPPLKRHKHVLIDVCSAAPLASSQPRDDPSVQRSEGPILERHIVPKSQGTEVYKFARRSHWGDLVPFEGKTVRAKAGPVDVNKNATGRAERKVHKKRGSRETEDGN